MQATGQKGFINDDGISGIYQHLVTVLETYSTEQTSKKKKITNAGTLLLLQKRKIQQQEPSYTMQLPPSSIG